MPIFLTGSQNGTGLGLWTGKMDQDDNIQLTLIWLQPLGAAWGEAFLLQSFAPMWGESYLHKSCRMHCSNALVHCLDRLGIPCNLQLSQHLAYMCPAVPCAWKIVPHGTTNIKRFWLQDKHLKRTHWSGRGNSLRSCCVIAVSADAELTYKPVDQHHINLVTCVLQNCVEVEKLPNLTSSPCHQGSPTRHTQKNPLQDSGILAVLSEALPARCSTRALEMRHATHS